MTALDVVIVIILVLSIVISVYRGLLKEFLSLLVLVAAFIVAINFSRLPKVWLPDLDLWGYPLLGSDYQIVLVFASLFITVLLVGKIISKAIVTAISSDGVALFDRLLGGVFGLLRGSVVVVALVLLAGLTSVPFTDGWRTSLLIPPFEQLTRYATCYMPTGYQSIHYSCAAAGVKQRIK